MDTSELALVFFSILAQLAVGSFLVVGLVSWLVNRKAGKEQVNFSAGWGWWAILGVMVLALMVSLMHLGNPKNAYLSVMNWQSAWLSREILCALLFTGFLAAFVFLKWKKIGEGNLQMVCGILAAVFGVALVYSMSMIYTNIRTQPAWNTPFTAISFFNTTFLLGTVGALVILGAKKDVRASLLISLSLAAIALLGIELVVMPIYLTNLAFDTTGVLTVKTIVSELSGVLVTRLVLAVLSLGVLATFLVKMANKDGQKLAGSLVIAVFALVLVAEFLGRFIFYVSNVRIGI